MSAFGRDGYDAYIGRYADAPRPVTVVPVPAAACEGTPAPEVLPVFEGRTDVVVFDQAETTLTWKVTVGTAGLYRVRWVTIRRRGARATWSSTCSSTANGPSSRRSRLC